MRSMIQKLENYAINDLQQYRKSLVKDSAWLLQFTRTQSQLCRKQPLKF